MNVHIQVPVLPESVTDATVATWHKKPGDTVKRDETVVDLETDKVVLEVPAPADGVLSDILHKEGAVVKAGEVLATLRSGASAGESYTPGPSTVTKATKPDAPQAGESIAKSASTQRDAASGGMGGAGGGGGRGSPGGPAARRLAAEQGVLPGAAGLQVAGGHAGITRQGTTTQGLSSGASATASSIKVASGASKDRIERRVPMSRLRAMIAKRLLEVQRTAAILTTFNEINLAKVMELRAAYKESFEKKHGVRLGLMSFFTKAVVEALRDYPAVNASIDGDDVIYYNYFDIGIAVSTDRGLMVPVVRDADKLSFAEIEKSISNYAHKAKDNQIAIEDMTGGTFTITNGGVFGSLLATPIINPPQSAILGMHKIEDRVVVERGQIVIRPMMYVALSYDHRIIDGKESIGFLNKIKEFLEEPARLLIDA